MTEKPIFPGWHTTEPQTTRDIETLQFELGLMSKQAHHKNLTFAGCACHVDKAIEWLSLVSRIQSELKQARENFDTAFNDWKEAEVEIARLREQNEEWQGLYDKQEDELVRLREIEKAAKGWEIPTRNHRHGSVRVEPGTLDHRWRVNRHTDL